MLLVVSKVRVGEGRLECMNRRHVRPDLICELTGSLCRRGNGGDRAELLQPLTFSLSRMSPAQAQLDEAQERSDHRRLAKNRSVPRL